MMIHKMCNDGVPSSLRECVFSSLKRDLKETDYIQPLYKESHRLAIEHLLSDGMAGSFQKCGSGMMESHHLSMLSSLKGDSKTEDYIQPHYKESYRLAIDQLVADGRESYQKFLKGERIGGFLSEEELLFITANAEQPTSGNDTEESNGPPDTKSSTGTYWPMHSDVATPELVLGWPEVLQRQQTHVELLFHPPRQNHPTIKEVIRKNIQDARQVIAIVMDMFTDIDIFKETVDASLRGVSVYVLLDESHLKSFLTLAENQDIKLQQLRNMRVRTVKGQNYLCRSGAKFHGAMQQRFLLVDCQTVIYGTYSFMWSYEKIHLSMVQVIRGHLVESYDEEFRTLYARSTVPAELCPPEGFVHDIRPNGRQIMGKYVSNSGQGFERKDQLRHTLDTVYRKTCERQMGMRDIEERLYEDKPTEPMPVIHQGVVAQNRMNQLQPPSEIVDNLKRHSYAGERQDASYIPQNARHRGSNWNVAADVGFPNGRTSYNTTLDNCSQGPQMFRGPNMRQSLHGIDQQVLSMQQNMATLESTSKSFMRNARIDSYLKNTDSPFGDSCEYLDQYEAPDNKANSFMSSRMRSSLALQSTIPEQIEISSYTNTNTAAYQVDPSVTPNSTLHCSSMQWNPTAENRMKNEEFLLKRQSLQILDDERNNISYGPGRNSYQSNYASLGRAKGGAMTRNPNIMTDNWLKRHSLADPRTNTDDCESPGPMYGGAFARRPMDRSTARVNAQNGGFGLNLNKDQRSVSHYDVKSITRTKSPPESNWQEAPSRTMSAAILDVNDKEPTCKSGGMSSPHFLKKGSKKIRSLLHIPEKKESSSRHIERPSSGGSTDTITAEDEEQNVHSSTNRYSSDHQRTHFADDSRNASSPRFRTEDLRPISPTNMPLRSQQMHRRGDKNVRHSHETGDWRKGADSRLHSRFEPFCAFEKKQPSHSATDFSNAEKTKSIPSSKGSTANEHNLSRATHGHHENKLERFIQRVGNLIHKNKQ